MKQGEIDQMRKIASDLREYAKVGNVNINNLKDYQQVVADALVMFPKLSDIIYDLLSKKYSIEDEIR